MKIRFLKMKDWLLMTAMGALGMTGCQSQKNMPTQPNTNDDVVVESPDARNEVALMYGVPMMDYVVKGRVIDPQGKPVEGIQVVMLNRNIDISPDNMMEDNPRVLDYIRHNSDTTDAQGAFNVKVGDVPVEQQSLIIRDIDGERNGSFIDQKLEVTFTPEDQVKPREGWYQGMRMKDVDITVTPKEK